MIVSWLSLFLPPESIPGRTGMAMTTLLTLAAMFGAVRQNTPKVEIIMSHTFQIVPCSGQLCLCPRCLDVQLHSFCLLHSSGICNNLKVCLYFQRAPLFFSNNSLMYRKTKPEEEEFCKESLNGECSNSIGIQTIECNTFDSDKSNVFVEEGQSQQQRRRPRLFSFSSEIVLHLFILSRFCPMLRRRGTAQCRPRELKNVHCPHNHKYACLNNAKFY